MGGPVVPLARLYRAAPAAAYLGVSETTFRALDLPSKRITDRIVVWDRLTLDAFADALPERGGVPEGGAAPDEDERQCDAIFGLAG